MNKDDFLKLLHDQPSWNNMTQKSCAGIKVLFECVYFEIFNDRANHFLSFRRLNSQKDIIAEFNNLWINCHAELQQEIEQGNMNRLFGDDNGADPIR